MMRILRAILPIAAALFAGIEIGSQAAKPSTYHDANFGFTIQPPAYTAPAGENGRVVAHFYGPAKDGFASNMNVLIQKGASTREKYLAENKKQFEAMGGTVSPEKLRTVNGWDAVELSIKGDFQGRALQWLSLGVITKDQTYVVTCTATEKTYAEVEKAFRTSLMSFNVDTPAPPADAK
jgi:hypothetical protein